MEYRFSILGTLDLRDADGAAVNSVLQQPRRLALLVYLALADHGSMVKRDTLLGLFWPDMTQENGRRALSQAIHFLRRSLGRDAIVGRGTEDIALNGDVVRCDAARFLAAARAGDSQGVMATYTGELLPGLLVSGAPEFDQWLCMQRDAMRRLAADAFWSAAEDARQRGQLVSAAASARRAAELALDSESATRRLIEFLDSIDDRAGALDAYEGLVRKLQNEFESTPSQKTRALGERIRRTADAEIAAAEVVVTASPAKRALRTLPWREIKQRGRTLTGAVILMAAFVSLWGLTARTRGAAAVMRSDASVAIDAPVVYDAALRELASTIVSDASAALVAVPRLAVHAADAPADQATAPHFVLKPSVSSENGIVRVAANLVDTQTGTIFRSASFSAPAGDRAAIGALAIDVAEFARKAMGRRLRTAQIALLEGPDAEVLSQAMLARIRADSLRDQGLAQYALLTLDQADALLATAVTNRPSPQLYIERAEIARAKAWVYLMPPLQDKQAADESVTAGITYADAAIQLQPENADAQELRGLFAYNLWFTPSTNVIHADARRDEAEGFLAKAVELNPRAARAWSALSAIHIAQGEFAKAYWAGERGYNADTYMEVADAITARLFTASLETGDIAAASRWCSDLARRANGGWVGGFCRLQILAQADDPSVHAIQETAEILAATSQSAPENAFMPILNSVAAVIYAKAGDAGHARHLLARIDDKMDEAQPFRAWALIELGSPRQARSVLNRYVAKSPSRRAGVLRSSRFAALPL